MNIKQTAILLISIIQITGCHHQTENRGTEQSHSQQTFYDALSQNEAKEKQRSPLLLSKDFGQTWENISQGLASEIQVSFLERKGDEILIATDNQGIFLSKDNHSQWKQIGAALPNQKINALHVLDNSIFVGVYRSGIFKSDDEGVTWSSLNFDLSNLNVQAICTHGKDLWVGTDAGIFQLPNNGKSWLQTTISAQVLSIYAYEGVLVAGTSLGTVISMDRGATWSWIRQEGAVHYTHNIGETIVELALNGDLLFSDDWGKTWIESNYEPKQGSYVYEVIEVGDYLIMSNNYGIHRSDDKGKTWNHIYPTETMGFFDFLVIGNELYGATRTWDEYRKRNR